jgi:uncharacterized membrane protein
MDILWSNVLQIDIIKTECCAQYNEPFWAVQQYNQAVAMDSSQAP